MPKLDPAWPRETWQGILLKLYLLAFAMAVSFFSYLPVHEWFHVTLGMNWVGNTIPYVTYPGMFSGLAHWGTAAPVGALWWTYLSGGLLTAVLWIGFGLGALWTRSKTDEYIVLAFLFIGATQFGYGLSETSLAFGGYDGPFAWASKLGTLIFSIPVLIWRTPRLVFWLALRQP